MKFHWQRSWIYVDGWNNKVKKILRPIIDDIQAITDTSRNVKLHKTSYPHLSRELADILLQYKNYDQHKGDAWKLTSTPISAELKKGLLKNYSSPPATLKFISSIRRSSPDICPMCGSPSTSTLDHVFPKDDYPEWAVFSNNLVPACDCNIKRKTLLKGNALNQERVLHPYFDTCLQTRQVSIVFTSHDNFRVVNISVDAINSTEPLYESIKFHIDKIVKPSGIVNWLENKWSKLRISPSNVVHTLPFRVLRDENELEMFLIDALGRYDRSCGTPNNWDSIFLHGIINSPGVLTWLFNRHNDIVTGNINPTLD